MALNREDPTNPGKYIMTKYSRRKLSDLAQLELIVIVGKFGFLCRQVYRKVSKQVCMQASKYAKQASMQVSGHRSNQFLATQA